VTQPFVFHTVGQIDPRGLADRQFEDVASRRDTCRSAPAVVMPEQGCFFLGAGNGNPEIRILLHTERHGPVVSKDLGKFGIGQSRCGDAANPGWLLCFRQ